MIPVEQILFGTAVLLLLSIVASKASGRRRDEEFMVPNGEQFCVPVTEFSCWPTRKNWNPCEAVSKNPSDEMNESERVAIRARRAI